MHDIIVVFPHVIPHTHFTDKETKAQQGYDLIERLWVNSGKYHITLSVTLTQLSIFLYYKLYL